ncbi:hypothetical protein K1S86_26370, partial [Klebsiella pneumoniae]|nr:hypothetical protein [Klebsiella pneumoniae]
GHLKIGVSVRHIFKPISYLEIQLLSGVSGGYINCTQDIARLMNAVTGMDIQSCRRRVVWCENVLDSELFYAMKREIEKEFPQIAA